MHKELTGGQALILRAGTQAIVAIESTPDAMHDRYMIEAHGFFMSLVHTLLAEQGYDSEFFASSAFFNLVGINPNPPVLVKQ